MEASINNVGKLLDKVTDGAIDIGLKLVVAVVIYLIGSFIIKRIISGMGRMKALQTISSLNESGVSMPASIFSSVLFPLPERPVTSIICPEVSSKSIGCTAVK